MKRYNLAELVRKNLNLGHIDLLVKNRLATYTRTHNGTQIQLDLNQCFSYLEELEEQKRRNRW